MRSSSFPPVLPWEGDLGARERAGSAVSRAGVAHLRRISAGSHGGVRLVYLRKRMSCRGDAAGTLATAPARQAILIEDVPEFARSWDKIIALNPSRIYPCHGNWFPSRI